MSDRRKLNVTSLVGMEQTDITVPEDRYTYGDVALEEIKILFDLDVSKSKILVGMDPGVFVTRGREFEFFAALTKEGYKWEIVSWGGRTNSNVGILVTRPEPELAPSSVLGP